MAMLTAYMDESISKEEHNLCLGAWLAPAEEWSSLEIQWRQRLDADGIKVFHAADCEHKRGEFKYFTTLRKVALQTDLIDIILDHQITGLCSGVIQKQCQEMFYQQLNVPKENLTYALATIPLLEKLANATATLGLENENIAVIYERRPKVAGLLDELFFNARVTLHNGARLSSLSPGEKDNPAFCMLQTSDLLAYEAAKHLYNFHNDAERSTRTAFSRLMTKVQDASFMDSEALAALKAWVIEESNSSPNM